LKAVAAFPAEKSIRLTDHPDPKLGSPTQVLLRMKQVGVCGTDREIASFQYGTPPPGCDYLVMGHESLGEVTEVGPGVTDLRPGDLVVPMVRRPCLHPECLACRSGRQDFCYTGDFSERGINRAHGFMAPWVVEERQYLNPVPKELAEVAVLVEPLTIAQKALIQVAEVQARMPWEIRHRGPAGQGAGGAGGTADGGGHVHTALVLGAGPVGLLGAMALVTAGYHTWVYSRQQEDDPRVALVKSIGAAYLQSDVVPVDQIAGRTGNLDLVYEATGASSLSFEVLEQLGTNGIFVFTGVPGRKAPISVDTDLLMRNLVLKNQIALGTVNAGKDAFEAAIAAVGEFMRRWPAAVRALITSRTPLAGAPGLLTGPADGIKNVILVDETP